MNVVKGKPLFKGHIQPKIPADLGFYDLRLPETREAQVQLAREAGVEGFCYYHYWFGGKQLLERPFNEVLASGKPDFPICLCWANHSWSNKTWNRKSNLQANSMLIEQTYPGDEDDREHFMNVLPTFKDKRYITIDGKPVFFLYNPWTHSRIKEWIANWRQMAEEERVSYCYAKLGPQPPVQLHGTEYIHIGDGCTFESGLQLTAWNSGDTPPSIIIGNNCLFRKNAHITATNGITIGNHLLTGTNVFISDNFHGETITDRDLLETPPGERPLHSKGTVSIGDNVWLGNNVCVLPGVTIGDGAIIGANSVVTHDIPAFSIAAGIPAKILHQAMTKTSSSVSIR